MTVLLLLSFLIVDPAAGFLANHASVSTTCGLLPSPVAAVGKTRRAKAEEEWPLFGSSTPPPKIKSNENCAWVTRPDTNSSVVGGDQTNFKLSYKIVRPMSMSSMQAAPIVVLHGGPSVPSNYLYPLESVVPYRSIVFYDQLGCGLSDEPVDISWYSIENAVEDLKAVLKKLGIRRFHLYGQSFGGILAFEYMKHIRTTTTTAEAEDHPECLSVVLSSTPTNVQQVEAEADRLVSNLASDAPPEEDIAELFRKEHQCRISEMPQPLRDAYDRAGNVWRGTEAIRGYSAEAPPSEALTKRMPSALILRGEYDFVTESCVEGWKTAFGHKFVRYKTLEGCSHHGLLEEGPKYGEILDSFFGEYD